MEAARGAVLYGFDVLGLEEIFGVVVPDNISSRRVLEKAGLTWIRRDRYYDLDCGVLRVTRATMELPFRHELVPPRLVSQ
jgi:RimJ/RimL family protein N-acetyltransferase